MIEIDIIRGNAISSMKAALTVVQTSCIAVQACRDFSLANVALYRPETNSLLWYKQIFHGQSQWLSFQISMYYLSDFDPAKNICNNNSK